MAQRPLPIRKQPLPAIASDAEKRGAGAFLGKSLCTLLEPFARPHSAVAADDGENHDGRLWV